MKLVSITLQLPDVTDQFYRKEAKRRIVSKSAVIREVLIRHVREELESCQQTQSGKTPSTSP